MTSWSAGRFVGYDLESTGTNPFDARILQAAVVHVEPDSRPHTIQWLLDPGIDVPDEAAQVHGWTRQRIIERCKGPGMAIRTTTGSDRLNEMRMHIDGALGEIAGHLAVAMHTDVPVVIANAAYDLTLTETELTRVGVDTITSRPTGIRGIVDPMVIEKAFDPYRKVKTGCRGGKWPCGGCGATDKKLGSLCTHYGIRLTGAHNAAADALAAVRLAAKLADLWPSVGRLRLPTLHAHQIQWRREQADSLRAYFDRNGTEHDGVDPGWPVHTHLQKEAVA
jgi:DNA polymerase-3 subunit epsilon